MSNGATSAVAKERTLHNSLVHLRTKVRTTHERVVELEDRVFGRTPRGAETPIAPDQEDPSIMDLVNNTHDVLDSLSDHLLKLEQTL